LMDPSANSRPELAAELAALGFPNGKVPAEILRLALISTNYTQPMNFSFDLLVQARSQASRLQSRFERLLELVSDEAKASLAAPDLVAAVTAARTAFDVALDDNLDIPAAIAVACAFAGELNQRDLSPHDALVALEFVEECDAVL